MANTTIHSLEELGKLTGLSPRTIRNYIQKGLLPGAVTRGRNASYTDAHLDRLQCIKIIRDKSGLPLDDLRMVIQSLSEEQIRLIGTGKEEVMALPIGQPFSTEEVSFSQRGIHNEKSAVSIETGEPRVGHSQTRESDAMEYIQKIRQKSYKDESHLAELVKTLEDLIGKQRVYRKAKNEWWATVKITEDMEIRARGLEKTDLGQLERLADVLRHLLMKGV
jgi:DNA-binding transcriptional MerR regulator